jgi:hypothetical protein
MTDLGPMIGNTSYSSGPEPGQSRQPREHVAR